MVPASGAAVGVPPEFEAREIVAAGSEMSDGLFVPMYPTGLVAFVGGGRATRLLVSHDIVPGTPSRSGPFGFQNHRFHAERFAGSGTVVYDAGTGGGKPAYGSVTSVEYGEEGVRTTLRLGGLLRASRGALTRHGSWLCGEAAVASPSDRYEQPHGYVFEVPLDVTVRAERRPALGRFAHAALAVDAAGTVYQTEARPDGLVYRFLPEVPDCLDRGRLQALALPSGTDLALARGSLPARWVDLDGVDPEADDLRARGAALGASPVLNAGALHALGRDVLIGLPEAGVGRLWRYRPESEEGGRLVSEAEGAPGAITGAFADVSVAPWGGLLVTGTGPDGHPTLFGRTSGGTLYPIVRGVRTDARLASPAFSPDGTALFVNLVEAGRTLAVTGPWPHPV